jgi:hypothetical protein
MLNAEGRRRVSRSVLLRRARALHAPTGRVVQPLTRREKVQGDRWRYTIGWADFYIILIFKLNYFIANYFFIFLFLYQNS